MTPTRSARRLHVLPYSPWSNKAQWALDMAGVEYELAVHTPMISEPGLRRRIRRSGARVDKATVPVLFEEGRPALTDSWDIACRAAELDPEAGLMPPAHSAEIERWNTRCEAALAGARIRVTRAVASSEGALLESLPRPLRLPLVGGLVALSGIAFFERKYGLGASETADDALRETLTAWRAALGGRGQLFDGPTYADLSVAVLLHAVEPPPAMVVGPASRRAWQHPGLAEEFADLVAWRDRLIARHPPRWDRLAK